MIIPRARFSQKNIFTAIERDNFVLIRMELLLDIKINHLIMHCLIALSPVAYHPVLPKVLTRVRKKLPNYM